MIDNVGHSISLHEYKVTPRIERIEWRCTCGMVARGYMDKATAQLAAIRHSAPTLTAMTPQWEGHGFNASRGRGIAG